MTKLEKPQLISKQYYDYIECESYIAKKLNLPSLRDTLGKYIRKPYDSSVEYRDFWHYIQDTYEIYSGSLFSFFDIDDESTLPWQKEIISMFVQEFGQEAEYWVS